MNVFNIQSKVWGYQRHAHGIEGSNILQGLLTKVQLCDNDQIQAIMIGVSCSSFLFRACFSLDDITLREIIKILMGVFCQNNLRITDIWLQGKKTQWLTFLTYGFFTNFLITAKVSQQCPSHRNIDVQHRHNINISKLSKNQRFDANKERISSGHNRYHVVPFDGKTTRFKGPPVITVYPAVPFDSETADPVALCSSSWTELYAAFIQGADMYTCHGIIAGDVVHHGHWGALLEIKLLILFNFIAYGMADISPSPFLKIAMCRGHQTSQSIPKLWNASRKITNDDDFFFLYMLRILPASSSMD
ncbi:hypothetical protein IEQ34_003885 [Dendrobium chrysotoxum]|uniref:Uncharacterized protein n=1 Tax=Dendrobium chrysotoxum TaxID=161865 RepID=A0AAV7HCN5_DENCH|nr:hypothetical protein IEQ34_003885 [Dendrobium chrysotoxum]